MQDNPKFYEYYRKNLNLTDKDFRSFITSLNTPLGFTFRILDINLIPIINTCPFFKKVNFLKNVYQCQKEEFKKSKIRKLIITYTNIGHIQRQEIVSMLPVLFLNLKPEHYVLDMCAAPGSKSSQIIEITDKGLIVCNDFNRKRLDILKSHTNKFNSKCLLILNNDARNLPNIKSGDEDIKFDRVLCDVPCSGDGTIRKNLNALKNWKEENGLSLHKTQFEILKRGLELLKEDGILVYSTCSFNPVENECVVQRAVLQLNCEIISDESLKEIKTRKGLKKWDLGIIENDKNKHLFSINEDIGLEKCMRVYPQDQDTGGFFIAVLRKKKSEKKFKLRINENEEKGIDVIFNEEIKENEVDYGLKIKNVETNEEINFSLGAKQTNENTCDLEGKIRINEDEKILKGVLKNKNDSELNLLNEHNIEEKNEMKNIYKNDNAKNNNEIKNIDKNHDGKNTNEMKNNDKNRGEKLDTLKKIKIEAENNINKRNCLFKESRNDMIYYLVKEDIKKNLEKQFKTEILDVLVTQSINNMNISIISENLYKISKSKNYSLFVISLGYKAFSKNCFKGLNYETYRVRPGVYETFENNGNSIIKLNKKDSLLLLNNEFVETVDLNIDQPEEGPILVSLHKIIGVFSAWSGKRKISVLLDKNYKKGLRELIDFKNEL